VERATTAAAAPSERLLAHNPGDGWEPLCAHLGVPAPNQPYPSRNNSSEFQTTFSMN
jgi:hypothetical protein